MPLSCWCSDDYAWYFYTPDDYSTAPSAGRRKRCSCGQLIEHGSVCLRFSIWRTPHDDIEERIHGDEVPMADKWLCERCADLFFSFQELGYECVHPGENMVELAEQYADDHEPLPQTQVAG